MRHIPDPLIVETVDRLLAAECDDECVGNVERGIAPEALWRSITASAINRAWMPEDTGGADASLADVCAIAAALGRHAAPVPLADTLLAGQLCATHGLSFDDRMLTLAIAEDSTSIRFDDNRLSGRLDRVPFARFCGAVVIAFRDDAGEHLARVELADAALAPGSNLAGEPSDSVRLDATIAAEIVERAPAWRGEAIRHAAATLRASMMSGALARVLAISVQYAQERIAFGRPIARFQAVQQSLAQLAGEVAAATAASNGAMLAASRHGFDDSRTAIAVASAKIRCGEAANAGAAIAHQVHGAMGFTMEHTLQRFTRRLWSWRDEHGQESEWAIALGRRIAADGADALWPRLTAI